MFAFAALAAGSADVAAAQTPTGVQPSGRGTTEVVFTGGGRGRGASPLRMRIDYGQPHARGRVIADSLIPRNQVWRTGANTATGLTTDVDVMIGGTRVPRGSYSLFTIWDGTGARLIVNKQTGQPGTEYDQAQDLARIPMTVTRIPKLESLSIWLIPSLDGPFGELRIAWGTLQYSVDWRVAQ